MAGNSALVVTIFFYVFLMCSQAHGVTGFIPADRTVDWSHAGIPGGIPSANWPVCQTISPSGGADDSVTIQSAINNCAANTVVALTAGTFKIHRASVVCQGFSDDYSSGSYEAGLCINKAVALRGAGPDKTIIQYGDGANIISLGRTYVSATGLVMTSVTAGSTKGSTSITLSSTSGIRTGSYLVVTQTNPTDPADGNPLVSTNGYSGNCTYCGHDIPSKAMTQIDRVTSVVGNVVTLERPLYFDYTNSPQIYPIPMVENAGLESLRLQPTVSSGTGDVFKNVNLEACAHCWVQNVESDMCVDKSHVYLSDVYGSEISNNYLTDGYSHNSGETYSIFLEFRNSENLIQNNIIRKARHSTPMSGGSGNVFAYNYAVDPYMGEYPNSLPETQGHGAHPFMNLLEGNVYPNMEFDFAHGSSSHNTVFRNYVNLTSTNPNTGSSMTGAMVAFADGYYSNYENVVGNVLGEFGSSCSAITYEINADTAPSAAIYKLGYYDDGGGSCPNSALCAKVGQSIVRGGNWDCTTNSVVWSSNVPNGSLVSTYLNQQVLLDSLYLSARPSWFTASGAVWPPIDPSSSTKVNKIPAQICYENGPKIGGVFKPSSCYGGMPPPPPTGLSAVVH